MIKAKKEFGQNFLKDSVILDKIVQAIPNDTSNIVEIGPGLGDLTLRLLKISKVKSYEIDRDLEKILTAKFADELENGHFVLVLGDALEIWQNGGLSEKKYFLAANLPYYVATNLILRAIDDDNCLGFVVMVQKEVALKFCATSKNSEFGAISVLANLFGKCEFLFEVPPLAFEPPPKVTSAVMRLVKNEFLSEHKKFANLDEYAEFKGFLRICFSAPRKTLFKNLSSKFDKNLLNKIFANLQISQTIRSHELDFALFLKIFKNLKVENERRKQKR
ncbi:MULTISPECIES: 16S rRNA (adenine(1518)-N(6)/adenine(1519)-N(6))-dimethyltransferase RsmA [unclassified Campylobacter]|uniref:16S rRNA (adenine(1518)-N(6)/adenine(1519)-N(6))- dimethyltransferase RsmA n=1 Tax=unclassified Campylobacter TaxID=2593542 RepID=UPI0022EA0D01|nr:MULTISPECIES: 16S rRNA (adenine(1518)-N(6)/adenine(1519)-N(6))-dimethyltransferase RsmA [unclassified Campylobacter]MDA3080098.1 16S rRNA (adenine(1518)-N(6)/adenine(1519)-N(6))-dimethyltransferase RsmA [Campylobacter sp. CS_NA2]MDA3081681.1 16S rRNA (adenine(1518)-N(6)/adenine(1519)-N(6))-dimethyltransferase RsmA [Campylobacter sp. CS_NA1]MDA3086155.1 16S rRNA (adenine(1518)-N(6)/adenine(1519)-N(6))-dimethyltransferase RsmA [Campylobacter sp. CS_ED1]MDA3090896.1 16S rRNA (adenine(1518)-N(6)